jgi:phytoene dehydrogenase-like protein
MVASLQWRRECPVLGRGWPINEHLHLALLGADDDGLFAQPSDHVERRARLSAQRQFQGVFLNALLDHLAQLPRDLEEPICRTQAPQRLMGPLVVVVLHPESNPLARLLEAIKLGPLQKLLPDRFPEPFDLAQRHRMMWSALDVVDPVFL